MSTTFRRIAAAALALPLALGLAASADAGSRFSAKSSGTFASAYWNDETTLGTGETVYTFGSVDAFGDRLVEAYGYVDVVTCPEGVIVWEDEAGECDYTGGFFWAEPGAVTLDVAKKGTAATLTGTVVLSNEAGDTAVPLDVSFVGSGPSFRTTSSFTYRDSDGTRYAFRATNTGRQAEVTGSVGDFDIVGDVEGSFGTYRQMEREVIR
jgi:hypothetical protein